MHHNLYDRDSALASIDLMLSSLQRERGSVLLIEGGAGSGKTRLVDIAASEAQRRGVHTMRITSSRQWLPVSVLTRGEGQQPRSRLILADDAHQIPPGLLDWLIESLRAKSDEPVGLLLTLRKSAAPSDLDVLLDRVQPQGTRVVLRPLTREAVVALSTDLLGAPPAPELRDWVLSAAGEPRLTRALLEGLREEDRVRVADGLAHHAPGDDRLSHLLPGRVHRMTCALLSGLSLPCRQLVCTAAVLGPHIDPERIARMLARTTAELLPAWEEALDNELVVRNGASMVFAHGLLREAVAQSLPATLREALLSQQQRLEPVAIEKAEQETAATEKAATQPAPRPVGRLTPRENSVLALLARGRSNQQIARALGISIHAVKRNVSALLIKLECTNRTEAALVAIAHAADPN